MTDAAYSAADRKDIRRAEKAARLAERQRLDFVVEMMGTPNGRRYAHDLLTATHVFRTSFSPDALSMAFAEGERNVGLLVLTDIMQACPDQYTQMMREANERSIVDTVRANRDHAGDSDPDLTAAASELPGGPESGRLPEGRAIDYDPFGVER